MGKNQYIKIFRHFNQMYEIYYDENGQKHFKEIIDPELAIYFPDRNGEYRYLLDENMKLRKKVYHNLEDYSKTVKKYNERGIEYYGFIRPEIQHIYNKYLKAPLHVTPRIAFFDIETGFDKTRLDENNDIVIVDGKGFPNIMKADFPIISIAINIPTINRKFVLGLKKYNGEFKDSYIRCENEKHLLDEFMRIIKYNRVDIITGWNTDLFDYPALFNRMAKLGINIRKMSQFQVLNKKTIRNSKTREVEIEYMMPYDYHFIDFLELYKNMTFDNKESYALNFIAELELGEKKLDYDGDLMELYNNDFDRFIDYNVQDVELLVKLEDKLKLHKTLYSMAYEMNCNFTDIFGTVVPWTAYIYKETQGMGIILPNDGVKNQEPMKFKGGWVECRQGHYMGILSYDFSSLYPSNQITFNISAETFIPDHELHEDLVRLKAKYTDGENVNKLLSVDEDGWREIHEITRKHKVTMTPNGCFFRANKQGIIPHMLETILKERKIYKNAMLKLEQVYEEMKHYKPDNENFEVGDHLFLNEDIMLEWSKEDIVELMKKSNERVLEQNLYKLSNFIDYCDTYQLVKKVQANSEYGYMGNQYALLSNLQIAQSITSTGRFMVQWVRDNMNKRFMEKHGFEPYIYADTDSVLGESKIYIEKFNKLFNNNIFKYTKTTRTSITIEDLYNNSMGKIETRGSDNYIKHINDTDLKALSMNSKTNKHEYKPIKYIMKHKVKKKMYRIKVDGKSVTVTEDHSIMVMRNGYLTSVKPKDIIKGDKIVYIR